MSITGSNSGAIEVIASLLHVKGFAIEWQMRLPSPGTATVQTEDLAVLARRVRPSVEQLDSRLYPAR